MLHTNLPTNMNNDNQCIDIALLATCMTLVYSRDTLMDVLMVENLAKIRDRRQHIINKNLIRNQTGDVAHYLSNKYELCVCILCAAL